VAADLGLQHRDAEIRRLLAERECRPEARVPAADDGDGGPRVTAERGRLSGVALPRERVLEPPRRQPRFDRGNGHQSLLARRVCSKTLPSASVTATTKIAVPITLICGGVATRAAPQTNIG